MVLGTYLLFGSLDPSGSTRRLARQPRCADGVSPARIPRKIPRLWEASLRWHSYQKVLQEKDDRNITTSNFLEVQGTVNLLSLRVQVPK